MVQIVLADEMDLVTRGARSVLLDFPDWTVAGECHSLNEALKQLRLSVADVVICGEQIDPGYDALSLVERLRSAAPNVHIILIGSVADGRLLRDLLHFGLRAYLNRGDPLGDCLPNGCPRCPERVPLSLADSEHRLSGCNAVEQTSSLSRLGGEDRAALAGSGLYDWHHRRSVERIATPHLLGLPEAPQPIWRDHKRTDD